jgi:hypothetical protein
MSPKGPGLPYGHVLGRSALPLSPVEALHRSEPARWANAQQET